MGKARANRQRTTLSARWRSRGATLAPGLVAAAVVLGIIAFTTLWHAAPTSDPGSAKPLRTQLQQSSTAAGWTLAIGLPSQVMRVAFSAADATRGYAAVFVNKQTQALYTTTDRGTTWQQAGTVQAPVADILSTDPLDSQDL